MAIKYITKNGKEICTRTVGVNVKSFKRIPSSFDCPFFWFGLEKKAEMFNDNIKIKQDFKKSMTGSGRHIATKCQTVIPIININVYNIINIITVKDCLS